ncbi:MAG: primosomal protein N' [Eubacteriales bacterium]|nr:primosomal protein N' [Eubacteriales bacterium]
MKYARIIIDISAEQIDRAFTYRIPEELKEKIAPGTRVQVPFGASGRKRKGIVIGLTDTADFDEDKIKEIAGLLPKGLDAESELIELAAFLANEYGCTMNQALMTVLPIKTEVRRNSRRRDAVEQISGPLTEPEKLELNADQLRVCNEVMKDPGRTSLLYGITGSGKTRVYMELIRRCQAEGKKSIVLIPEISLTYQIVTELTKYFGQKIAVMHSKLSRGEKYDQYKKALSGEIDVCVGPRSALFTPFKDLGLIIIDEEHERTYQSETSPRYDVREAAIFRAKQTGAKLLMGSATPSLESYKKALNGTYDLHVLKTRAHPGAKLPKIHVADMRRELELGNRSIFSAELKELIDDRLGKHEQIMLFLNRRGYAGFVSCRSCGRVIKCPHCDVSLTAHNTWYVDPRTGQKQAALLSCHYCGYTTSMPASCPDCGSRFIAPFGTGTQKLEQACRNTFPGARILRMDADTTSAKHSYENILSAFKAHKADILIGTQMIVKGHDFENVTLVGIVAADLSLNTSDYNASERTYQLITQAAGRSGRGELSGDVVIQSYDPSHYAISCAAERDYEAFYEREMSYRRLLNYPPETFMMFVRLKSEDEEAVNAAADLAVSLLQKYESCGTEIIGPCSENIYKINDNYRKIIYIKNCSHDIIMRMRTELSDAVNESFSQKKVYTVFDVR